MVTLGNPERIALDKAAGAGSGALASVLAAALAARLFGSRLVAVIAGFGVALDPSLVLLSADIQSETIFVPLLLAGGLLLLAGADRPSTKLALGAGALLAAAALTRPSALALFPLLAAAMGDRRWPVRVRAQLSGAALLGFGLTLAPWTARNFVRYHELIPVSDSAGATFYDGNSPWTLGLYQAASREEQERLIDQLDAHKGAYVGSLSPEVAASPSSRSRALSQLAFRELAADPGGALRLYLRKFLEWWRPYPSPLFWPWPAVIGVGLFNVALYMIGAAGLARASRRGAVLFVLLYLAATMIVHIAFLVVWRYRTPFWNPVFLIFGALVAGDTLSRWRRKRLEGGGLDSA